MSAPARPLVLGEVQALIVEGYKHHRCRYWLLTVQDARAARTFLAALVQRGWVESADAVAKTQIAPSASGPVRATPVSVGIGFPGLRALGLKPRYLDRLQTHAPAFYEGAACRSASRLADTGASAARYWDRRFDRDRAHVLLAVHGNDSHALDEAQAALTALAGAAFGPDGWRGGLDACHLRQTHAAVERRVVHFGFVDGISKVFIKGVPRHDRLDGGRKLAHEPGEFLLGYRNDKGYNPWLMACEPPDHDLPPRRFGDVKMPSTLAPADFFRGGSFAAFRDMAQDERAFRTYTDARADALGVTGDYLRAKMLGRWQHGPVVLPGELTAPPQAGHTPAALDNFDFSQDADGLGCPFGSHVRRMNPRADGVVPFRRRPLIRRGMPYGPVYAPDEPDGPDRVRRGLLGLFFCASLEDQFEHLVSEWGDAVPLGMPNKGSAKDPLIGNHTHGTAPFDIPMGDAPLRQLDRMGPFVTTRGTVYLFFPGLHALRAMDDDALFTP
ncbi:MAG: Dyp-type peroxidase family [Rhodoferax sp.]|nr:Dyp-type peroxidase family [Rhodoferax sp.]